MMVTRQVMAAILGVGLLAGAGACTKPVQPSVVYPGLPFNITPGRAVAVPDSVTVIFDRVASDSRCPTDVICIAAGDAVAQLTLADSTSRVQRELHTASADTAKTTFGTYTIHLIDLTPYPRSTRVIDPRDYTATLQITSP
jgi:hypothetical protein